MSKLQILKWILLVIVLIASVVLGVVIAMYSSSQCLRDVCIKKAKLLSKNINSTVNPCEDFYSFACRNSSQQKSQLISKYIVNRFSEIGENITLFKDTLFQQYSRSGDYLKLMIGSFHTRCVVPNYLPRTISMLPILRELLTIIGISPQVLSISKWKDEYLNIAEYEFKSRLYGFEGNIFFSTYIAPDFKNPENISLYIGTPHLQFIGFNQLVHILSDDSLNSDYKRYVQFVLGYIRDNISEDEVNNVINIQLKIADLIIKSKRVAEEIYLVSIDTLQKEFPFVDWKMYLDKFLHSDTSLLQNIKVVSKTYLTGIQKFLTSNETTKYNLALYMVYTNLLEMDPFIYHSPEDTTFWQNAHLLDSNPQNNNSRFKFCQRIVEKYVPGALTSLVIDEFLIKNGGQQIVFNTVTELEKQFNTSFKKSFWMDDSTKNKAMEKLKKIKHYLALPNNYFETMKSVKKRDNYYENLCYQQSLWLAIMCANKFIMNKQLELLYRTPSVFDVDRKGYKSMIMYNQEENSFVVPPGVLQFPEFDPNFPSCLNYGAIGSVISRTLSHGFDKDGANFDAYGIQNTWWSNETFGKYEELQKRCNKTSDGRPILNSSEIGVLKLTYEAYMNSLKDKFFQETTLPGLEQYSNEQLFFINNADLYCRVGNHSNRTATKIMFDSISVLDIFTNAFGCKNTNKTDRDVVEKCSLW